MNQFFPFVEHILKVDSSSVNIQGYEFRTCYKYVSAPHQPYNIVNGATALHFACLVGNLELAGVLLRAGADWNIKDHSNRTPQDYIHDAHGECHANIFKRMCEEEDARRKSAKEDEPTDATKADEAPNAEKKEEVLPKNSSSSSSSDSRSDTSEASDGENEKGDDEAVSRAAKCAFF